MLYLMVHQEMVRHYPSCDSPSWRGREQHAPDPRGGTCGTPGPANPAAAVLQSECNQGSGHKGIAFLPGVHLLRRLLRVSSFVYCFFFDLFFLGPSLLLLAKHNASEMHSQQKQMPYVIK